MAFGPIRLLQIRRCTVQVAAIALATVWVLCGNWTVSFGEEPPRLIPADEGTVPIDVDWDRFDESVL
ncbi:MAG: hypothetical protein D6741_02840, partial [Planctomycetota bacterium]